MGLLFSLGPCNMRRLLSEEILRSSKWAKEGSHFDINFPDKSEQPVPVFPIGC